jgi:hypothetical protein
MTGAHRPVVPVALEELLAGLGELETVLGETARPALAAIRGRLIEAAAARDRGDPVATLQAVSAAMADLAALADRLDPPEGRAMRAVAERFGTALLRGDLSEAKQGLDVMFERSGARRRKAE